jgi:hypothetical protein
VEALNAWSHQLQVAKVEQGRLAVSTQDLADVAADLTAVKNDAALQYSKEIDGIEKAASSVSASLDTAPAATSGQRY